MKLPPSLRSALLILVSFVGVFSRAGAAPGDVDLSFDAGSDASLIDGRVNAVALQPDGKVVIGGNFTTVKGLLRRALARLNADGSPDSTFVDRGPNEYINYVSAVVIQPDGKLLVGYESGIARLNADGTPDPTFESPSILGGGLSSAGVGAIALQPDGKILIGGTFEIVDEQIRDCIARLNADGTLDHSFDTGGGGVAGPFPGVYDIALQSDGKLLIAGQFYGYRQTFRYNLARINPDGTLDESFDAGLTENGSVAQVAIQPDGKVLFGGSFLAVGGTPRRSIARVNADGSLDSSFDPGSGLDGGNVWTMALHLNGSVLIGGTFNTFNGTPRKGLARLTTDGSLDGSFEPVGPDRMDERLVPTAIAIDAEGKLLVGGYDMLGTLPEQDRVVRLHANGSRDESFVAHRGLAGGVGSIAVQPDAKIMIGGGFRYIDGTPARGAARLHPDGTLDRTFNLDPEVNGSFRVLLPDGKMLVVGGSRIARVHADGSLDRSFDAGTGLDGGQLRSMAVQPDGKVLVAGSFDSVNGVERRDIVRLNADGSVDSTFVLDPGLQSHEIVSVAVQPDGKVLLGGMFMRTGETRFTIAVVRLTPEGIRDATFNFPRVGTVHSMVIQPDGKVIVGGSFSTQENDPYPERIARLNADGSIDNSFQVESVYDPETGDRLGPDEARSLVLQPDGKVLAAGLYYRGTNEEGHSLFYSVGIYRLNPDGTVDASFAVRTGPVGPIALQADGKVLVGGSFLQVNGVIRPYLARLYGDPVPALTINRSGNTVIVSWPSSATGFVLQHSSDLHPATWTAPSETITDNGTTKSITSGLAPGRRFFRLFKP